MYINSFNSQHNLKADFIDFIIPILQMKTLRSSWLGDSKNSHS